LRESQELAAGRRIKQANGLTFTGFALSTAHGVAISSWPVAISNTVCLVMSATVLVMKIRLDI